MKNKIVTFHEIDNVKWFEEVLLILQSKYTIISIEELESYFYSGKDLKNCCHITIDDGHSSFYSLIYPILKKHRIPATLFVSPMIIREQRNYWFQQVTMSNRDAIKKTISEEFNIDINLLKQFPVSFILKNLQIDQIERIIDRTLNNNHFEKQAPQNISIEQLMEIDKEGLVTIGGHTLNHPVLANEDIKRCREEIIGSISLLRDIVGHEIHYFAYPNGIPVVDFGEREIAILKENNCRLCFSSEPKNFSRTDNPLNIPRFMVSYKSHSFLKAKLLLGKHWETIKNIKSQGEKSKRIDLKKLFDQN